MVARSEGWMLPGAVTCLLSIFVVQYTECHAKSTLRQVHVLYRHGDRSPVRTFPTDPNQEDAWPQGFGQLTTIGMQEQHALGDYFRKRYIDDTALLSSHYTRTQIQVRSTNVDRTLMSAMSNLAGLYPPSGSQIWDKKLLWQPVPVHTVALTEDMLLSDPDCPVYNKLEVNVLNSPEVKKEERDNMEFYKKVAKHSGMPKESITTIWDIYDALLIERIHNKTGNAWVTDEMFEKMSKLVDFEFRLMYKTPAMKRLTGGVLVNEIIANTEKKIQELEGKTKGTQPNMYMYSAHDTTVAAYLSANNAFNDRAPPYCTTVMVELHEIFINGSPEYSLKFLLRNDSMKTGQYEPIPITIANCEMMCPVEKYKSLMVDVRLTAQEWLSECSEDSEGGNLTETYTLVIAAASGALGSLILVLLIGCVLKSVQKRRRDSYAEFGNVQA